MNNRLSMKKRGPFFSARGWRALGELVAIQIGVIGIWSLFSGHSQGLEAQSLFNSDFNNLFTFLLLYSPVSVLWGGLRWRTQSGRSWGKQMKIELSMTLLVGLIYFISANLFILSPLASISVFHFLNINVYDRSSEWLSEPRLPLIIFFMDSVIAAGSAGLFLFLRGGIRIIRSWNRLRRQHLSWSLTHAILMLPVIGVGVVGAIFALIFLVSYSRSTSLPIFLVFNIFFSGFLLILALVTLLPPIMLFSHFFGRRITQRIEMLASATSAMRMGKYSIRVPVQGEDEVARLQNDFNIMAAHLEHTMRELQNERDNVAQLLTERRELIASVSHELRTPVATMRGYLESTLANWQKAPPPTLQQDLEVISQQTVRLQGLINDLFMLARAEVGRLKLRCVPTPVDLLVGRIVDTMAPLTWRSSRVEIVPDIAEDLPQAMVDEGRLEQILQNLLNNGVRHTPPGGIIAISAQADVAHKQLVLQVKDTGEGIPADELSHIWDRFYRTRKARSESSVGTGLGLAIVKEMTEAMGGSVEVESTVGMGTCFTIRVPQAAPQEISSIITVKLQAVEQQQRFASVSDAPA
ncbi:sensor histidine kinase [Ktedonospora formicarum]|uniref:histidine kinase n=1 Tax=Ktedonospora formicarum TaxID=2778364 RepID=A0A8J3MZ00_9CHLR|nr:HAMP domain-containing sensor histidine kinase [Ktedonospora formicarum]GHO50240.1 hypothetical protein KSX_84030 [Ktedonospora formicarum]